MIQFYFQNRECCFRTILELQRSTLHAMFLFPQKVQISYLNLLQRLFKGYPFFCQEDLTVYSSTPLQVYFHLPVSKNRFIYSKQKIIILEKSFSRK